MAERRRRRAPRSHQARSKHPSSSDRPLGKPAPRSSFNHRAFLLVLATGIALRIVAFAYMGYLNNDNHLVVIEYIAQRWIPPHAGQFNQSFHPPLYYFLAAAVLRLGNLQGVHILSLILSIGTLWLIAHSLRQLPWIDERIRPWCLALAAFHTQFIMFGLFISNDALAIFLGTLIFYQCRRVQMTPSLINSLWLGIYLGLGLLTKAVFLVYLLPLILFIWLTGRQRALPGPRLISRLALVLFISAILGCCKYVENFVLFGNPTVSNLDIWLWTEDQQPTWIGFQSLIDFNLLKLVRHPVISTATVHSYPLMLYGSFWYSLIPESTFHSNLISPLDRLGSLIYLVALCPTLLMLWGATRIAISPFGVGPQHRHEPDVSTRDRWVYEGCLLLILLLNFFLILAVGWSYDVWSVFQGRLLFPSYIALLLAFSAGMEWAQSSPPLTRVIRWLMTLLIALFLAYLIVDVLLALLYPVNPLQTNHIPYEIDMNAR
jgi:Dolichyl-phosphate-mannose-protein mannosyltransferase